MNEFDFDNPVNTYCRICKKVTAHGLADSANFGNVLKMCDVCESESNYTEIDHKAIMTETRKGF